MKLFIASDFLLFLFFSWLLLITGCGETPQAKPVVMDQLKPEQARVADLSPAYGDVIIETSIADAVTLNPLLYTDSASGDIIALVFNGLVRRNENLELTGKLAETWEVSSDGKIITFQLRKNVLWHDGEPFTADDVKFTYDTIMDPNTKTPSRNSFSLVQTLEVLDSHTVRAIYKEPFAPALSRWAIGIIPKHLFENEDINTSKHNQKPIGTGPFQFLSWTPDDQIALEAFDRYFDGRPYVDRYIYKIIPDPSMAFLSMLRNEIDIMGLTKDQYNKQANSEAFLSRFNVYVYPSTASYSYIGYNLNKPKFSDRSVRQALTMAIDRQIIVDEILYGYGKILTGPFAPTDWAYDQSIPPFPYDPAAAVKLLEKSGWVDTDGDGYRERNGEKLEIELATNNGNETRKLVVSLVRSFWEKVGIRTIVQEVAWNVLMNMCDSKEFDAIVLGWDLGRDPDHYGIWHSAQIPDEQNKNRNNFISYSNPEADRLWEQGRTTFDQTRRKEIYHKLHAMIHEDQPYTFLYVTESIVAVDKRIHGIKIAPAGIFYNFEKWYVPKELQRY
ncbi:MAG: peptide-binding protein [Candidatus Wallbacteria bacterium]|nr:peptide-binding protein [Candidatus Wallbacteria bacterium]